MGEYSFEIDLIGPTKGRDDTEVENGIFPESHTINLLLQFLGLGNTASL